MSDAEFGKELAREIFQSTIRESLDAVSGRGRGGRSTDHVVYECYVYALVLQALFNLGYNPRAKYLQRGKFSWRACRGKVYRNPERYSHVEFTANGKDFVLLNDIEVCCKSRCVDLEVDVLVISKQHFEDCVIMSCPSSPSHSELRLILEAKHYSSEVDVSVSKAFVGMCDRLRGESCYASLVSKSGFTDNGSLLLKGVLPPIDAHTGVYGFLDTENLNSLIRDLMSHLCRLA